MYGTTRPNTTAKTRKVAVYPDGRRYPLRKIGKAWEWDHGKSSYPLAAAIDNVKLAGGTVVTEPNPDYRGKLDRTLTEYFTKLVYGR